METGVPLSRFSRIGDLVPLWQPFAQEIAPGLDYFAGSVREPRLEFRALRVDLSEPALRIVTSGDPAREKASPGNGAFPSTWVSNFVRRHQCLAGINTAPFSPVTGQEGEARTIEGLAISQGVLLSPPHPFYDALVFYKTGGAAIVSQAKIADPGEIAEAAGGFFTVLRKGSLPERLLDGTGGLAKPAPRHPRSAGGLSEDGTLLYLLVIDGRRPGSVGATEAETGLFLKQLGASEGINFDGGGSTALALRYPDGKVRVANTPIHRQIPGRERGVAACLGIAAAPGGASP